MKNRIDWDLILNYLEGKSSESEARRVEAWVSEDEKNKAELDSLKMIWTSRSVELPKPDVERALQNVKRKIENASDQKIRPFPPIFNFTGKIAKRQFTDIIFSPGVLKIAATLAVVIVGAIVLFKVLTNSKLTEIAVANKVIEKTTLPDGTKVTLDSGSQLKYSEDFGNKYREVSLAGEGYFEVSPDKSKQFIIHTNSAKIAVIGTKFNVRAWDESRKNVVGVVEGEVRFSNEDADVSTGVTIRKGQMSYIENGFVLRPENVDVSKQLLWLKREMKFESTPLKEVLAQIERWYDVKSSLPDDSYRESIVTVFLENKPLEDVVEMIALIMKFNYKIKGNVVSFTVE